MKLVLLVIAVMMWFASPVYAQYSNEPENAPNKADSTDESEDVPKNDED